MQSIAAFEAAAVDSLFFYSTPPPMITVLIFLQALIVTPGVATCQTQEAYVAQDGYISPQQQRTLLEYAGPNAKPLVPTAIKRTSEQDAGYVAKWLADNRKQALLTFSLDPKKPNYYGQAEKSLDMVFQQAEKENAVLYFDDADALFGIPSATQQQKDAAKALVQLAKKSKGAVLFQCVKEDAWYALAEFGFGILDMKL
jgi:hypothetical protein